MSFISYAQNLEDVILWKALKDVQNGFYIDVGANHPVEDSVTKEMYDRGWHGINIEPEDEFYNLLLEDRQRDLNLKLAVSSKKEDIKFYILDTRGWSTSEKSVADQHKAEGHDYKVKTIETKSLDEICKEYSVNEVHFLKIDVEGGEKDVLESFSFENVRPWIVVVEATQPNTVIDISEEWEHILLNHDYIFAYFDGINKYYVSKEHANLLKVLKNPPTVLDDFISIREVNTIKKANEAETKVTQAETKATQAETKATQAETKATQAEENYNTLLNSYSWKVTKPFRLVGKAVQWFVTGAKHWITFSPTSRPRRVLKQTVLSLKHSINANPKLKMQVIHILNHFPGLKAKLKNLKLNDISNKIHERDELTFQAQKIYTELKQLCNQIPNTIQENKNKKMAIVTPIPPDQTGIADYIAELLPSLSNIYNIEIITDTVSSYNNYPVYDIEFFKNNTKRYNRIIYQVGNSPHHWYMFDLIKKIPGIVVLHDFYLGNMIHWLQNNKNTDLDIWDASLLDSHGYSSVYMRAKNGINWATDYYPANIQMLQYAKGVIVHSEYAKTLATNWYGRKFENKFYLLPQVHKEFLEPKVVESKEFLVCSFGHVTKQKMIHKIISAWIDTGLNNNPNSRLVFVGNCGLDEYDQKIKKLVKSLGNVELTGFIQDEEFHNYLINANAAIQLREESKGETSRAVLDCMAYGIPTIINKNGSMAEFPDNAVYKISDKFNEDELCAALSKLHKNKTLCNELSKNAKAHISQEHRPDIVSNLMQDIIEEIYTQKTTLTISELCQSQQLNNIPLEAQELSNLAKEYEINERNGQVPNLYIDISVIAINDLKTGIQRVVRAILISLFEMQINTYKIIPVYLTNQNGYWHYRTAHHFMQSLVPDLVLRADSVVEPSTSEIFLGLDFHSNAITQAAKAGLFDLWKKRGVSINFVVYDILPIQFPKFFPTISYNEHFNWLNAVGNVSDNILCISRTVANDVRDYLIKSKIEEKSLPNVDFFHLGADIENSVPSYGLPKNAKDRLVQFSSCENFLMIGTVEPRKGHMQTLLAFEALWKNNIDINLTIVGKEGWAVEELSKKIRKHPELNKRLFWIEGASDEYLEKIYAASTCLIVASEGEGFGLPLIEAAQHKLPIIARDLPVFREVAGENAFYFENDNDPLVIVNSIGKWLELYKFDKHQKSDDMHWLTWKQSAEKLMNGIGIYGTDLKGKGTKCI